jgi:RES domain-containing protein
LLANAGLASALAAAPLSTCCELWVNVSPYKWRHSLLTAAGASISSGRYHIAGKAPALYFAKSPVVALTEVGVLAQTPDGLAPNGRPPQILISVHITIPLHILDLTHEGTRHLLGTELQELTGSWLLDPVPATQRLGQLAHDSKRIVAIRYPSRVGTGVEPNLVVFIDRLKQHAGCKLEPYDPNGDLSKRIKPILGK